MKEEHLIKIWFERKKISKLRILNHGCLNTGDGPDILDAEILVEDKIYRGPVEIDLKKSYWLKHGHFQNRYFQNTILHLFMDEDLNNYNGYHPKFSLSLLGNKLQAHNQVQKNFLQRRLFLYKELKNFFSFEEIVSIFFARTLGLYKNRDVMMYFAIAKYLKKDIYFSNFHPFKKAVRPENRIDKRKEQFLELELNKSTKFTKDLTKAIYSRRSIKLIYKDFADYPISRARISLFIFNYLIPLLLFTEKKENIGFFLYLEDIFLHLHKFPQIKELHPLIPEIF